MSERELSPVERAVLDHLLAGDDPVLEGLRAQARAAHVTSREHTGSGLVVGLDVPASLAVSGVSRGFHIGDVHGAINGHDASMVLIVREGRLDTLDSHVWGEASARPPLTIARLRYAGEGPARDLAALRAEWRARSS